jgi:hypothetical protein
MDPDPRWRSEAPLHCTVCLRIVCLLSISANLARAYTQKRLLA